MLRIFFSNLGYLFLGKGCCVLLKAKWHESGASIYLSVRQKGIKKFVDIEERDNLAKNVKLKF